MEKLFPEKPAYEIAFYNTKNNHSNKNSNRNDKIGVTRMTAATKRVASAWFCVISQETASG